MRVGWISISLGVTATPAAVEDRPRGLTTISWVETCAPVADSDTKHGRYASTAAEVVATCAQGGGAVDQQAGQQQGRMAEQAVVGECLTGKRYRSETR